MCKCLPSCVLISHVAFLQLWNPLAVWAAGPVPGAALGMQSGKCLLADPSQETLAWLLDSLSASQRQPWALRMCLWHQHWHPVVPSAEALTSLPYNRSAMQCSKRLAGSPTVRLQAPWIADIAGVLPQLWAYDNPVDGCCIAGLHQPGCRPHLLWPFKATACQACPPRSCGCRPKGNLLWDRLQCCYTRECGEPHLILCSFSKWSFSRKGFLHDRCDCLWYKALMGWPNNSDCRARSLCWHPRPWSDAIQTNQGYAIESDGSKALLQWSAKHCGDVTSLSAVMPRMHLSWGAPKTSSAWPACLAFANQMQRYLSWPTYKITLKAGISIGICITISSVQHISILFVSIWLLLYNSATVVLQFHTIVLEFNVKLGPIFTIPSRTWTSEIGSN